MWYWSPSAGVAELPFGARFGRIHHRGFLDRHSARSTIVAFNIDVPNGEFTMTVEQKVGSPIAPIIAIGIILLAAALGISALFFFERITKNMADAEVAKPV